MPSTLELNTWRRGEAGVRGPAGESGVAVGPQGTIGPRGPQGEAGSQIERRGDVGPRGPQGERGPRGEQGMAGPAGEGDASFVTARAGEPILGFRVVYIDDEYCYYVDNNTVNHASRAIGITLNSAAQDDTVNIRCVGVMQDVSFNFVDGLIFIGANGQLTQSVETIESGLFIQSVGTTIATDSFLVSISNAIIRG